MKIEHIQAMQLRQDLKKSKNKNRQLTSRMPADGSDAYPTSCASSSSASYSLSEESARKLLLLLLLLLTEKNHKKAA